MANTFTYTARSVDEPTRVVTFTLYDRSLAVEPGTPEWIKRIPDSIATETTSEANGATTAWSDMIALLKQTEDTRFDLVDVEAAVEKAGLRLMTWARSNDRRWWPMTIIMEHVDNPEAAHAFVKELHRRKMLVMRRENFLTWIGYRVQWFLVGVLTAFAAIISFRLKRG